MLTLIPDSQLLITCFSQPLTTPLSLLTNHYYYSPFPAKPSVIEIPVITFFVG